MPKRLMKHLMISTTANSVAKTDKGRLKKPNCTQKLDIPSKHTGAVFYDQIYASNNKPHPIIYTVSQGKLVEQYADEGLLCGIKRNTPTVQEN